MNDYEQIMQKIVDELGQEAAEADPMYQVCAFNARQAPEPVKTIDEAVASFTAAHTEGLAALADAADQPTPYDPGQCEPVAFGCVMPDDHGPYGESNWSDWGVSGCKGQRLDVWGEMLGEPRRGRPDYEYRDALRSAWKTIPPVYWNDDVPTPEDSSVDASAPAAEDSSVAAFTAAKHDGGKPRMDLLVPGFLEEVAEVLTFGAKKYQPYNWCKGLDYSRLYAAVQRHLNAFWDDQDEDPETGLSHLAHAACGLMFLWAHERYAYGTDDRPGYAARGEGGDK